MTLSLFSLAFIAFLCGGWLYLRASRRRQQAGIPAGEIIYVDTGSWRRNDRPLFSQRFLLTGKPDYLLRERGEVIPVEVKSGTLTLDQPYPAHKLQLAAYCLLVEETQGSRPQHGILNYANVSFQVPYDGGSRQEVIDTLAAMRKALYHKDVARSHDSPGRCQGCGFQWACGSQALL